MPVCLYSSVCLFVYIYVDLIYSVLRRILLHARFECNWVSRVASKQSFPIIWLAYAAALYCVCVYVCVCVSVGMCDVSAYVYCMSVCLLFVCRSLHAQSASSTLPLLDLRQRLDLLSRFRARDFPDAATFVAAPPVNFNTAGCV